MSNFDNSIPSYPNNGTVRVNPFIPFPDTITDGETWNSGLLSAGFGGVAAAATSDHAATLEVQRYADLDSIMARVDHIVKGNR